MQSSVAPEQTLTHHKVSHCTDKGEVPVVPEVDIYGTCCLGNQHQKVEFDDIMVAKSRTYMDIMRMRDPGEYQRLLKLV